MTHRNQKLLDRLCHIEETVSEQKGSALPGAAPHGSSSMQKVMAASGLGSEKTDGGNDDKNNNIDNKWGASSSLENSHARTILASSQTRGREALPEYMESVHVQRERVQHQLLEKAKQRRLLLKPIPKLHPGLSGSPLSPSLSDCPPGQDVAELEGRTTQKKKEKLFSGGMRIGSSYCTVKIGRVEPFAGKEGLRPVSLTQRLRARGSLLKIEASDLELEKGFHPLYVMAPEHLVEDEKLGLHIAKAVRSVGDDLKLSMPLGKGVCRLTIGRCMWSLSFDGGKYCLVLSPATVDFIPVRLAVHPELIQSVLERFHGDALKASEHIVHNHLKQGEPGRLEGMALGSIKDILSPTNPDGTPLLSVALVTSWF